MTKATLTISEEDGKMTVHLEFEPSLPPGERTPEWLETLPSAHLAGILAMDHVMEHCEGEVQTQFFHDNESRH